MKNPLNKRIKKELKSDITKYLVIFLFMIMLISLVSGFLVADNSFEDAYNKGFDKYNIEDGHFALNREVDETFIKQLEASTGTTIYNLSYFEEKNDKSKDNNHATIRVYKQRETVNLVCLMSGKMPEVDNEIALDRMYADNSGIKVGDTISIGGRTLVVSGLIAMPDYSCLFEKNSDMMFDAINFSVAVMTNQAFEAFQSVHMTYNYAWNYAQKVERTDVEKADKLSETFLDDLTKEIKSYDESVIDETIDASKLVILSEMLSSLDQQLSQTGMSITMYDSEEGYQQLLNQINQIMAEKKIDLVKEFKEAIGDAKTEEDTENVKGNDEKAEGNEISTADKTSNSDEEVQLAEKVAFTIKDVKRAMKADQAEIDEAKEKQETVSDRIITVTDYLPRYQNKAINFTGEDMGSDKIMFLIFDYIVVAILAFVFAVTTSNTITSEAGVIGTLRASGYTRSEILRHYMVLPVLVTVIAAVIGNIFGYTFMKKYMVDLYYGSYSLATYKTLWNAEAFIDTTVVPIILMFLINFFMISSKLKLSPLRFLRRDLSKRGKKKAFRLNTKIPIMIRFRIRILFQNIPNYITLAIGVFFGGAIVIFGLMFGPMLEDYSDMIQKSMIANYQYVLMNQEETNTKDAEKYCVTSLMNTEEKFMIDEVMIYGVEENSAYIKDEIPEGKVYVSNGMAAKYKLKKGSKFELKSPYGNERYEFEVAGEYKYDAALSIFLPRTEFNQRFDKKDDYFTGYFSNEGIHDIDEDAIVNVITLKDLTKVSDQLHVSIGSMTSLFQHFGVVMFLLLMFIMSKQIIEKNSQSISMTKILGFRNGEIGGLYIVATSIIVLLSLLISIPLVNGVLRWIFSSYIYTAMTGYLPFIVSSSCYIKMFLMGVACYLFVGVFQLRKIGKISKSDALKNVE